MIKVATISTANKGGAGIAAYRLHQNLNQSGLVHSNFINSFSETSSIKSIIKLKASPSSPLSLEKKIIKKISNRILSNNLFFESDETKLRNKIASFDLNCEFYSIPYSNFLIEKNEQVVNSDIVHLHWVADFLNYETFFKNINTPIVWTLHDMNPFQGIFHYKNDELNNSSVSRINKTVFNEKMNFIHQHKNIHIVCLTQWMYEASINSKTLGNYPHYLIPNGLDFSSFNLQQSPQELKSKYNILNDNKTLLFISQDITNIRKGIDLLKGALEKLPTLNLNIITVGNNEIKLPENFTHIHFNHIDDMNVLNELYTLADLFVLPSREDNLPNVMLESFANGTPVLAFNTGGMKDWIIQNETGILVKDIDSISLAKEITNFANGLYSFDASIIKQYATENFNKDVQTKKYIELYQNILN